ncbi:hypothetical protein BT69DRAFT_1247622 [Atractiella rhizophila]|nr:hypothetical protein BT69DRAFT_1247622 [Atractiella rhizophila]
MPPKRNYIIPKSTAKRTIPLAPSPPRYAPAGSVSRDPAPEIIDLEAPNALKNLSQSSGLKKRTREVDGVILLDDDSEPRREVLGLEDEEDEEDQDGTGDDEEGEELLAVLNSKVAGQQHYSGASSMRAGQHLAFRREPHNRYDRNAIEILHPGYTLKIGHVPAVLAKNLAPLIDTMSIKLEGQADFSQRNYFTTGVQLHIYGKRSLLLDPRFAFALPKSIRPPTTPSYPSPSNSRFRPASQVMPSSSQGPSSSQQRQAPPGPSQEELRRQQLNNILASMQTGVRGGTDLFASFAGEEDLSTMKEYEGELIVKTPLLGYQKQGLYWMIKMEHPEPPMKEADKPVQLWVSREDGTKKQYWYNLASREMTRHAPYLGRGGILADEMGLGKTLTTIALITTDDTGDGVIDKPEDPDAKFDDMTLICCPLSVLSNWTDQLKHTIKNRKAKMSKACAGLTAERRWILTGTPIVNNAGDLGSMMQFLKMCKPLDKKEDWSTLVDKVVKRSPEEGGKMLKAIVRSTTLRRTKDMKDKHGKTLVPLPELTFLTDRVKLDAMTRALYDEVDFAVSEAFRELVARGEANRHYTSVLTFLLRLRQIACDPVLCPQSFIEDVRQNRIGLNARGVGGEEGVMVNLDPDKIKELQAVLERFVEDQDECAVCYDSCTNPVITPCKQVYCKTCILEALSIKPECPMDRGNLSARQLIDLPPPNIKEDDEGDFNELQKEKDAGGGVYSAKTKKLIEFLRNTEEGVKTLVFSQWTSHLNRVEMALEESGISTCRLDGAMSQKKREKVIAEFSAKAEDLIDSLGFATRSGKHRAIDNGPPTVMLISLKAGAVGLNLTAASQVVLLDPWWQSAIEQQAIDRVYRIGQTKPVRVIQMVAENTVEDKVLDIQKQKEELVSQAFDGKRGASGNRDRNRVADMAALFGVRLGGSNRT